MAGSAIPTTVESSAAIPDPSTVAASTQRPTGLAYWRAGDPTVGGAAGLATSSQDTACGFTDVTHRQQYAGEDRLPWAADGRCHGLCAFGKHWADLPSSATGTGNDALGDRPYALRRIRT